MGARCWRRYWRKALAIRLREGSVPGPNMRRLIDDGADFGHIPDMAERVVDSPMQLSDLDRASFEHRLKIARGATDDLKHF